MRPTATKGPGRPFLPMSEKLWGRIDKSGDGCWPYTGTISRLGYGVLTHGKRTSFLAHRLVWEEINGPIPDGLIVRHKCDNPPCCNPDHLELGTHYDNAQDRVQRGRNGETGRKPVERCQRGHDDWYIQKPDGRRRCRPCRNAAAVARNRVKKDIPSEPYSY